MTRPTQSIPDHVPGVAAWLGAAGLVPFAAGSLALWVGPAAHAEIAAYILVAYGAVILSFLGAIYWGLAAASSQHTFWFALGVVPALAGWCALLLTTPAALLLLIIGFAGVLALDRAAVAGTLAPAWYLRLRAPLSAAVIALLAVALAAVWKHSA